MKYTEKLGLKKPELTDYVNIEDINDNMDVLDEEVGNLKEGSTTIEELQTSNKTLAGAINELKDEVDSKETPQGAQEKADAALNSAKQYTDQEVGEVAQELAAHKAEKATQDKAGHIKLSDIPLPAIATQSEAEAGTNNTKMMTPLRVANAINSKIIVVDNMLQLNINGEWKIFKLVPPADTTGAPGNKFLIAGDTQKGFFGEVPANELITGDELASLVGLSSGTSKNSTAGWLKFAYQGKILFIAKKPLRSVTWNDLNIANVVYGDRQVVINGVLYKIRLIKGANIDPVSSTTDGKVFHGSEWNKLMLPIHIKAKYRDWAVPANVIEDDYVPSWGIDYTDADLGTDRRTGDSHTWCQELVATSNRLYRSYNDASDADSMPPSSVGSWRPVLEVVE